MEAVANDAGRAALTGENENFDLSFLPQNLTTQCRTLIVSYHELHGYACLPNILWKARLGHRSASGVSAAPQEGFNDQKREEIQREFRADSDDDIVA
jgi:hypothetical protein